MTSKALYFPFINVPNTAWFVRVLLYWNKVASIVPANHVRQPQLLDPFMRDLVEAGLVEPVVPSEHINKIPKFSEGFLNYVQANFKDRYTKSSESIFIHPDKMNRPGSPVTKLLHIEKIDAISSELVDLGLARLIDNSWYQVESRVAKYFMTYLAITLGRLEEIDATAITDRCNNLRFASGALPKSASQRRRRVREILLSKILPSPKQPVGIHDLISFKEKHEELLTRFRRAIETTCMNIADLQDEDPETVEERLQYEIDQLEEDLDEIKKTMKSRWHQITMGSLVPVLGAGASLLATPANPPLAAFGAAMSLADAIYQAFDNETKYRDAWRKPLAYAALAQSHLLQVRD